MVALPVGTPGVRCTRPTFTRELGQRGQLAVAGGVLAHPADHVHARPQPPGRGGLVGALAAGREHGAAADDRLPAAGQPVDGDQHVLVQAADDGDGHATGPP